MAVQRIKTKHPLGKTGSIGKTGNAVTVRHFVKQTGNIEKAKQDLLENPTAFLGKLTRRNMGGITALISLEHALGEHYFLGLNYCKQIIEEMEKQNLIEVDWKHKTFTVLK